MKNTFKLLTVVAALTLATESNCMLRGLMRGANAATASFSSRFGSLGSSLASRCSTVATKFGSFSKTAMQSNPFARFSSFTKPSTMATQSSKNWFAKPSARFGALAGLSTITASALLVHPAKAEGAQETSGVNVESSKNPSPAQATEQAKVKALRYSKFQVEALIAVEKDLSTIEAEIESLNKSIVLNSELLKIIRGSSKEGISADNAIGQSMICGIIIGNIEADIAVLTNKKQQKEIIVNNLKRLKELLPK